MLRMMIVDDEPIIVEGLYELFQHTDHLELELYQAFDGFEAMEIAVQLRIDIVLTDYHMPEMNGHELQRQIIALWPRCKVIFLTGYDDFEYIQATLRSGAIDFVLKTEGDEPIIAAVEKAIRIITEEVNSERFIRAAKTQIEAALPSLRRDCLYRIVGGDPDAMKRRRQKFEELQIPLDFAEPVYIVLGRIDQWREDMAEGDKALFMFSVHNIVEEYLMDQFSLAHFIADHDRFVWILQQKERVGNSHSILLGTLELIQDACKQYLKLVSSFVVSSESVAWEQLPQTFDRLSILFETGLGLSKETLLTDERIFADGRETVSPRIRRIRLLSQYLSQKDRANFSAQFEQIMNAIGDEQALQTGVPLEVFYELSAIFIAQMNRLGLFSELSKKVNISKLLSIREHETWQEVTAYFHDLSTRLFDAMTEEKEQATNEVVQIIHDHIATHLHDDLSLNRLAGLVYLTPFYVSRLYKQITQQSISDYIAEQRIERAKKLLSETPLKVHEIGIQIGYDSPAYFTRFFKKMTNLTPQEFRDSLKRI